MRRHAKYDRLITAAREIHAVPTAVAHPCDESSLAGALDAAKLGIIAPILVGPREWILAAASATSPYSRSPRRAISVSTIT